MVLKIVKVSPDGDDYIFIEFKTNGYTGRCRINIFDIYTESLIEDLELDTEAGNWNYEDLCSEINDWYLNNIKSYKLIFYKNKLVK